MSCTKTENVRRGFTKTYYISNNIDAFIVNTKFYSAYLIVPILKFALHLVVIGLNLKEAL